MTDILKPKSEAPWGEDIHLELARALDAGLVPDEDLLRRVEAHYVMAIRVRLQIDPEANWSAAAATPATDAEGKLSELLSDIRKEGTERVFSRALRMVLEELDELRKLAPARYIVDGETGKLMAPLTEETVFVPPPVPQEDDQGNPLSPHQPLAVVHPAITSGLALRAAEANRDRRVAKLAADPVNGAAYQHMVDPQRIVRLAREKLAAVGVSEADLLGQETVWLEFGKEGLDADLQSTNVRYHRLAVYSALVATHVFRVCGAGGVCWIGPVELRKNSRQRWYAVPVRTRTALELS